VGGLVLLDDRGRDTPALAYLVALVAGPGADFRAALAARAAAGPAAAGGGTRTAGIAGVRAELVVQFLGVCRAHVDLVRSSLKGERNRLLTHDLVIVRKVADDSRCNLACHGSSPSATASLLRFAKHIPGPLRLTIAVAMIVLASYPELANDGIPEGLRNSP